MHELKTPLRHCLKFPGELRCGVSVPQSTVYVILGIMLSSGLSPAQRGSPPLGGSGLRTADSCRRPQEILRLAHSTKSRRHPKWKEAPGTHVGEASQA